MNLFPATSCIFFTSFCLRRLVHLNSVMAASIKYVVIHGYLPLPWNLQIIEKRFKIELRQTFGSTEPLGTAPNIHLQYELLITRIVRRVELVKQRPLRANQIQILLQHPELCGQNPETSSFSSFIVR